MLFLVIEPLVVVCHCLLVSGVSLSALTFSRWCAYGPFISRILLFLGPKKLELIAEFKTKTLGLIQAR